MSEIINDVGSDSQIQEIQFSRKYCKYCGKELQQDALFCSSCGRSQIQQTVSPMSQQTPVQLVNPYMVGVYQQPQPVMPNNAINNTTTIVVERSRSNGMGTAGFVLALLGLVFCWLPVANFVLWFLGLVFSFIGLFKSPRGLAITGIFLSFVLIIAIILFAGVIAGALAAAVS